MQLIFWAHSNSATKQPQRNFSHQVEKVYTISYWRVTILPGKQRLEQINKKQKSEMIIKYGLATSGREKGKK